MGITNLFAKPVAADAPPDLVPRPPSAVRSYGLSERGQKRKSNEDCFVIAELARTLNDSQL